MKKTKNARVLDLYARLCQGKAVNKSAEAKSFGVNERSIQRDIDDIRAFLQEQAASGKAAGLNIKYDRVRNGFVMMENEARFLDSGEILAVSKILLESRAFTRKEIDSILERLIAECVSSKNRKVVSDLIANEQFHYVELAHRSDIQDSIWDIGEAIQDSSLIKIKYCKLAEKVGEVQRMIEPLSIMFSEYYFYLIANIVERDTKTNAFQQKYQYPAVFRMDRIQSFSIMNERFKIPYRDRFEEGEFRKRVQFMYPGDLIRLQFKYKGKSPEAVLDRLPTAQIQSCKEGVYIIEAQVYGTGIIMWLLSQGEYVEILKPAVLREEMQTTLRKMIAQYEDS